MVADELPDVVIVPLQLQLAVLNVPSDAVERRLSAAALVLHQQQAGVHRAADGGGAGDTGELVLGVLLPQMVNQQDSDAVGVGYFLQRGQVTVVVGVGLVVGPAHHLQCVDDDQHRVGVLRKERLKLRLQSFADECALRTEVDVVGRVLRHVQQPVLDAEQGVLQAEVERGAALAAHAPDRLPFGNRNREP